MAKEPIFDVLRFQRLAEKWVRAKIDHARRQVIASSPVSIDPLQLFGGQWSQDFGRIGHQMFSGNSRFCAGGVRNESGLSHTHNWNRYRANDCVAVDP